MPDELEMIEREAKLFEAGDYLDRDVNVTEDDLDKIIKCHEPVEIRIEHEPNPLKLGMVTKLWRTGKELFGKMAFTPAAWALVEESNAKNLSIGLKRDKSGLTEVSLVRIPRVAGAQVFKADVVEFSADVDWSSGHPHEEEASAAQIIEPETPAEEVKTMPEVETKTTVAEDVQAIHAFKAAKGEAAEFAEQTSALVAEAKASRAEIAAAANEARAATRELQATKAEMAIAKFKREGKVVPATEEMARAILGRKPLAGVVPGQAETVTFSDKPMHFAELFEAFLDAMPPVISFSEMVRNQEGENDGLTDDQVKHGEKYGLTREAMAKYATR